MRASLAFLFPSVHFCVCFRFFVCGVGCFECFEHALISFHRGLDACARAWCVTKKNTKDKSGKLGASHLLPFLSSFLLSKVRLLSLVRPAFPPSHPSFEESANLASPLWVACGRAAGGAGPDRGFFEARWCFL